MLGGILDDGLQRASGMPQNAAHHLKHREVNLIRKIERLAEEIFFFRLFGGKKVRLDGVLDIQIVADLMDETLMNKDDETKLKAIKEKVTAFSLKFPVPGIE